MTRTLLAKLAGAACVAAALAAASPVLAAPPVPQVDVGAPGAGQGPSPFVRQVQSADPRVFQLEEQVRSLTGRVEELNFLILELQEQLRRMQKDNEFRFQELEGEKKSDAGPSVVPPAAGGDTDVAAIIDADNAGRQLGAPAQPLGTIRFDAAGNPVGAAIAPGQTASIQPDLGPDQLYQTGYDLILAGDYAAAEPYFRDYAARFPGDARAVDAKYWLGESLLGQKRYTDAAEAFLGISRDAPQSAKAPESLLKLGIALAGLGRKDVACATFKAVGDRYPQSPDVLKARVEAERANAQC